MLTPQVVPQILEESSAHDNSVPMRTPGKAPLRVLLVDSQQVVRQALKFLLATESDVEIVGDVGTTREALQAAEQLKPSVAVIDIALPDRSGIELAAELRHRESGVGVLILTAHATEEYVVAALSAGALGYVLKDASHAELSTGLRAVGDGQIYLCVRGCMKAEILPPRTEDEARAGVLTLTTEREREVLRGIALGQSNKNIARTLTLSVKTVEKHRANLMRKLGLHNTASLTMFAVRQGIVCTA